MHDSVRLGDVKQPVENIEQGLAIVGKQIGQFLGIDLKSGNILLRQVEQADHIPLLARRHVEKIPKGKNLIRRHDAIRLCHFRRERDHGDRETNPVRSFRP